MTVCDTGEVMPDKLVMALKNFDFVELQWFLPTSLLQTALHLDDNGPAKCHCCTKADGK